MADINYIVNQDSPETIAGVEKYSEADKALVTSYQVNSLFDSNKNTVELHILSLADELLESEYNYVNYKQLGNAQSAGKEGASILTIDPIADSKAYGYELGGIKLLYHFINDLFSTNSSTVEFYIESISEDRTELIVNSLQLTQEDLVKYTDTVKNRLQTESNFSEYRVNFKDNDLFIGINIDTLLISGENVIAIKLYEPLPTLYNEKSTLSILEFISDSVAYEVDATISVTAETPLYLKPANFNVEIEENSVVPSQYYDYDELFSYPVDNASSQVYSMFSEKGIEISIDHTSFSDFIHFSSAEERLANFKYKVDLIENYSTSKAQASSATKGLQGVSGSVDYYNNLITGVINNFDHYERYLYYESGSTAWPKSTATKPYGNQSSNTSEAILWYANQIENAVLYDNGNFSSLINAIPAYLRDDSSNQNYLTFVHMIGQHFDNIWLYAKAVTDKYDADNRLNKGVSKDLIADTLKNFGVKLYTSNKSLQDLFTSFTKQEYSVPAEVVNHYQDITAVTDFEGTSYGDYQKEIYKRIYHNLPLLLKSKGTERGVKALINCFGIPSDILTVKLFGGAQTNTDTFFGDQQYFTSSLGKIRLDNTGSLIEGNTLSEYTSTVKKVVEYTDDLHRVEIGFSPIDNINNYIISYSLADPNLSSFNMDNYIGDPRDLNADSYGELKIVTQQIADSLTKYNLQDHIRLIKFFDNVIFKMVRDFVPARSVTDTGIIIKPNILTRSKAKSVIATVETINTSSIDTAFIYPSSIDTAFISGSDGRVFGSRDQFKTTTGSYEVQTPTGPLYKPNSTEDKKYNGEFEGSNIVVTVGELNADNPYKAQVLPLIEYATFFYTEPVAGNLCTIVPPTTIPIIKPGGMVLLEDYFTDGGLPVPATTVYKSGSVVIISPYTFTDPQYSIVTLTASASGTPVADCTGSRSFEIFTCSLAKAVTIPTTVQQDIETINSSYNLTSWFVTGSNSRLLFEISQSSVGIGSFTTASISASAYEFKNTGDYTVKLYDTYKTSCIISQTVVSTAPGVTEKFVKLLLYGNYTYPYYNPTLTVMPQAIDSNYNPTTVHGDLHFTASYGFDNSHPIFPNQDFEVNCTILAGQSEAENSFQITDYYLYNNGEPSVNNSITETPYDAYTIWTPGGSEYQ